MKRFLISTLTLLAIALPAAAQNQNPPAQDQPQQPSLADAARAARAARAEQRKPKVVIDNDNLPKAGVLNVMGEATAATDDKKADPKGDAAAAAAGADAMAKAIDDKKAEIAGLNKEIDLLQREHKLKQTMGYVDVGTRLRDQKKWDDDEKKFNADLADRQKRLADAQKVLAQLESQAKALAAGR